MGFTEEVTISYIFKLYKQMLAFLNNFLKNIGGYMKKVVFLSISLILVSIINISCYDYTELASVAMLSKSGINNQKVQNAIEKMTQQLFADRKVESERMGDNTFIKPKSPYTYQDIQIICQEKLKKLLGNNWEELFNDYMNRNMESSIQLKDIPQDIVAAAQNSNDSYNAANVTDTGLCNHFYDCIPPSGQWVTAQNQPSHFFIPISTPYGWWAYWGTRMVFTFTLPSDSPMVDSVSVMVMDENGQPYNWISVSGYPSNTGTLAQTSNVTSTFVMYTGYKYGLLGYPKRYTSSWTITVYETSTPEVWSQSF
jgi:hypothetical protein